MAPGDVRDPSRWYAKQHFRNLWAVVRGPDYECAPGCVGRMTKEAAEAMADDLNRAQEGGNIGGDETIPAAMTNREEPSDHDKQIEAIEISHEMKSTFDAVSVNLNIDKDSPSN